MLSFGSSREITGQIVAIVALHLVGVEFHKLVVLITETLAQQLFVLRPKFALVVAKQTLDNQQHLVVGEEWLIVQLLITAVAAATSFGQLHLGVGVAATGKVLRLPLEQMEQIITVDAKLVVR